MHSDETVFYFAGQAVHWPRCVTFCGRQQPAQPNYSTSEPLIGYLEYSDIDQCRQKMLQPQEHPGGGDNAAGLGLFRKKLYRITPKDWTLDPYFVCVMLSFGQLQERLFDLPQDNYTVRLSSASFVFL